jgi:hypothetical protein
MHFRILTPDTSKRNQLTIEDATPKAPWKEKAITHFFSKEVFTLWGISC